MNDILSKPMKGEILKGLIKSNMRHSNLRNRDSSIVPKVLAYQDPEPVSAVVSQAQPIQRLPNQGPLGRNLLQCPPMTYGLNHDVSDPSVFVSSDYNDAASHSNVKSQFKAHSVPTKNVVQSKDLINLPYKESDLLPWNFNL